MRVRKGVLFLAALSSLGLVQATEASAADKKLTIALIPGLTTDAFYITMHKGAEAAAKELGVDLVYQGAPEWNVTQQEPVLNAVIARHPDAILIANVDKDQLTPALKTASDQGIKIITVDQFIGDGVYQTGGGPGAFATSFIASDNELGGRIAASAMAKAVGEKGKVYVANVKPGITATDAREHGFIDEMKKHPGVAVLETQYNDDDASKAAAQLQAVLARAPDLVGVFGANLFSAHGAAGGVKAAGKSGQIKVIAFDAPTSIIGDIRSGVVDMAIAQHPAEMGYYGVVTAVASLREHSVPAKIGTGFTLMDKSNIDDPNVAKYTYSE
jgi:ribose transport system substrate-binding protein